MASAAPVYFFAWSMANVCPATVSTPSRLLPGFGWIVIETVPGPDRVAGGGTTIQVESLVTVQEHPAAVPTVATAVPPSSLNDLGVTEAV